jgi:hypothetical protein
VQSNSDRQRSAKSATAREAPKATLHTFRTDLAKQPLAELLGKIGYHRLSGIFRVEHGGVTKELHLRDGYVNFASSSDLRDSLGAHLVSSKVLTQEAHDRLRQHPDFSRKKLGVLLMEQQLLLPNQVRALVQQQVANIAWSLFGWERGSASFEICELPDNQTIRIQIPVKHMVLKGNRRAPAVKRMLDHLGGEGAVFVPVRDSEAIIDAALDESEYALYQSIDGKRTVGDLCDEPPLEPEGNIRLLHALHCLRLIDPSLESAERGAPAAGEATQAANSASAAEPTRQSKAFSLSGAKRGRMVLSLR